MFDDNANLGKDNDFINDRDRRNNSTFDNSNETHIDDLETNLEDRDEINREKGYENSNNYSSNSDVNSTAKTPFAEEELNRERENKAKEEKKKSVEYAKKEIKRMAGAEFNPKAEEDIDINAPEIDKGKRKSILNPKYRKIVYIISGIFGVTLLLLLFNAMFGSKEETLEQPKIEDIAKEETLSTDDLNQLKSNTSINGQESSFSQQLEQGNSVYDNINLAQQNQMQGEGNPENENIGNGNGNINGVDPNQQQMDEIDAREQESLKALEEMERQAKSDSYDTDDTRADIEKEVVEKPRKNRNMIKLEGAESNIAVFKGGMDDRIQYVSAKQQKESALNQMGVSTKKRNGSGIGSGANGGISGGVNIDYQANEVDKAVADLMGRQPTDGVKFSGNIGGSANNSARANKTPYYAYEKEEGKYDILEGTIIPAVIMNEINSDYPGRVTAIVREDVYDSLTGNFLLIPKGSKVMGEMIPLKTNGGLERVATVWDRIILTNGDNIFMDNFKGLDLSGIDGIEGKVNKRYFKKIASIVASSIFEGTLGIASTLPEILLRKYDTRDGVVYSESGGQVGERIGQSLTQIVDGEVQKVVTRPNTVKVKSGTKTNILVNVDIRLPKFERVRTNK
jgi:conjugal transfer protein trbI